MTNIKKISDQFSAGGQPDDEDLKRLADAGFKSVVNLRSPEESGALVNEGQLAEDAGLQYVNIPVRSTEANAELTAKVIAEAAGLPTPIYFHCGAGGRASAAALIAFATEKKLSREDILEKARESGIDPDQPQLRQFLESLDR
jgi:uncharacterized protein (TIGR01244 family)